MKAGLLLIIVFAVMSLFTMCMGMFSNMTGVLAGASYLADDADIEQAELSYTEWETDLRLEIQNAETTHNGYDEYRYAIGNIGHDPHELMAFLTAVYNEFVYADVENVLLDIFNQQYNLEFVPEIEIRIKMETRTDTYTDPDTGEEIEYEYEVEVEYEWYILNVTLSSIPLMDIIFPLMDSDQFEHFFILTQTKGARQYAGNPFNVNWLPYVTSHYGYRIYPITGVKDLHRGIDIGLPMDTQIRAGINGTVTAAFDNEYGNYIVINDGNGLEVKYAHCNTLLFSTGQTVTKGEVIATVGSTGTATGAHLHMEIVKDGIFLNPIYFVESLN